MTSFMRPGAARAFLFCALVAAPCVVRAGLPGPLVSVSRHARVTLLGERHRTWGAPALLLALVEDAVFAGEIVAVGLEIPADRQAVLDRVAASDTIPHGLVPRVIDSPAYRSMLRRLGQWARAFPGRLELLAVDAPQGSRADRDGFMAGRVLEAIRSGTDRVVVLVGNLHVPSPPGDSLGARLERLGIPTARVLTLGRRRPVTTPGRWYGAAHAQTRAALRTLWSLLARPVRRGGARPVHGLVTWAAPPGGPAAVR